MLHYYDGEYHKTYDIKLQLSQYEGAISKNWSLVKFILKTNMGHHITTSNCC